MNNEDFVTYEQAVALKKLGFTEKVTHYYETNSNIDNFHPAWEQGWNTSYDINVDILSKNFNNFKDHCSAPTLAQAQKWLKNAKNVVVIASPDWDWEDDEFYYDYLTGKWYFVVYTDGKIVNCNYDPNKECEEIWCFDSPEEALSAGITECIKLLENKER